MELNKESFIAIIRLIVTAVGMIATTFSWTVDTNFIFNILVSIAAGVLLIWTWWKNNNVTEAAQQAQEMLNEIKAKNE